MKLLQGCWIARLKAVNPADTNTSVINYYQGKEGTLMTEVLHEFIQVLVGRRAGMGHCTTSIDA